MAITEPTEGRAVRDQGADGDGHHAQVEAAPLELVTRVADRLAAAMNSVIEGKPDVVRTAITVLLAEGHLLLEDVPGVGKTMLAKTLAKSIDCSVRRVQFTPDLLPSDITGVSVFNQDVRDFEFRPGAIFANVVVGVRRGFSRSLTAMPFSWVLTQRRVRAQGALDLASRMPN